MVPTGSIYERNWRTRWSTRVRLFALCAVGALAMLAAASAHADWRTGPSVPERPNNVLDVWAPEVASLGVVGSSRSGAYLLLDGGISRAIDAGTASAESVGTYYHQPNDCLVSVRKDGFGRRNFKGADGGACGGSFLENRSIITPEDNVLRVKHAAQDGGAAVVRNWTYAIYLSESSIYDSLPFALAYSLNTSESLNETLGVVRAGGKVYALVGTSNPDSRVYWVISSGLKEERAQSEPPMGAVMAIELFPAGSPEAPYAVVGTKRGFLQGTFRDAGTQLRPVQVLDGDWSVNSVSMNVAAGGDAGTGFGMAVVKLPDGDAGVMSPVPMLSDTEAGTLWRFRSLPETVASAPLKQVACTGASYCVFTADRAGGSNVFIYTNDAGPSISASALAASVVNDAMDASVTLNEGLPGQLTFAASDPDGDPVLVTASHQSVGSSSWTVTPVSGAPGDPVVVQVTPGVTCQREQQVGSFQIHASDGLAKHDAHKNFRVFVKHTRAPEVPTVVFSHGGEVPSGPAVIELAAGGAPLTLRALGDTSAAGCRIQKTWEPRFSGTGVPLLAQDGGTAVITPPRVFCQAEGGDFNFRLYVEDEGGLSNFKDFKVHVMPWGPPNPVFREDSGEVQLTAGESLALTPDNPRPHDCVGSPSFPGVMPLWHVTLSDGGVPGSGVTFRDGTGGLPIQSFPAPASTLVVEAPHCLDTTQLLVTSEHHVGSVDGLAGPSSVRQVMIQTNKLPFDAGVLELDEEPMPSDELHVTVTSNLNCEEARGLRAELQLEPLDGGGPTQVAQVDVPGEWRFPLGLGCQGGNFQLKASMTEETGLRSLVMTEDVAVPRFDAGLEPLSPTQAVLVARCNEGVRATLEQRFPEGACQTATVTWTQVGGPELEQGSLSGNTVSLATRDTGLDELVGRSVVLEVTADAGTNNAASDTYTLPITVEPFVKLRRRTEVPAASETGLVGVSVELLNTTACGVTDVSYVERMEGMTYVEGSAKFNGQPVTASWNEGALTVTGLSLGSDDPGTLTYVARPHLVSERRMEGEAQLRGVPISISPVPGPQVPDSGCGCTSSGPGPMLFALGALVAAVRRRRR